MKERQPQRTSTVCELPRLYDGVSEASPRWAFCSVGLPVPKTQSLPGHPYKVQNL